MQNDRIVREPEQRKSCNVEMRWSLKKDMGMGFNVERKDEVIVKNLQEFGISGTNSLLDRIGKMVREVGYKGE